MADREELLDLHGVAEALGITYKSARNYLGWGKLGEPDVRLSNVPGWYRSSVDRLIAERTAAAESRAAAKASTEVRRKAARSEAETERAAAARRRRRATAARQKRRTAAKRREAVPLPGPDHEAAREMFG